MQVWLENATKCLKRGMWRADREGLRYEVQNRVGKLVCLAGEPLSWQKMVRSLQDKWSARTLKGSVPEVENTHGCGGFSLKSEGFKPLKASYAKRMKIHDNIHKIMVR